jgi:hypothetical protein
MMLGLLSRSGFRSFLRGGLGNRRTDRDHQTTGSPRIIRIG